MQEEAARRTRPLVLPEPFKGDEDYTEWEDHFESVAAVNEWDDADKLKWLRVRLAGRAKTAFKRLPDADKRNFESATAALRERFEPASKQELHIAEFQTRKKLRGEGWADFGDALRDLADKAYPELDLDARERLSLNSYLEQISDAQVAFGVRQARPRTVREAVISTLQLESFKVHKHPPTRIAQVSVDDEATPVGVVAEQSRRDDTTPELLQAILTRLERLETSRQEQASPAPRRDDRGRGPKNQPRERRGQRGPPPSQRQDQSPSTSSQPPRTEDRRPVTCLRCGKEGHYARGCAERRRQGSGNC